MPGGAKRMMIDLYTKKFLELYDNEGAGAATSYLDSLDRSRLSDILGVILVAIFRPEVKERNA